LEGRNRFWCLVIGGEKIIVHPVDTLVGEIKPFQEFDAP
jgi:hypothetical protein